MHVISIIHRHSHHPHQGTEVISPLKKSSLFLISNAAPFLLLEGSHCSDIQHRDVFTWFWSVCIGKTIKPFLLFVWLLSSPQQTLCPFPHFTQRPFIHACCWVSLLNHSHSPSHSPLCGSWTLRSFGIRRLPPCPCFGPSRIQTITNSFCWHELLTFSCFTKTTQTCISQSQEISVAVQNQYINEHYLGKTV